MQDKLPDAEDRGLDSQMQSIAYHRLYAGAGLTIDYMQDKENKVAHQRTH